VVIDKIDINGNGIKSKGYRFFVDTLDALTKEAERVFSNYRYVNPHIVGASGVVTGVAFSKDKVRIFYTGTDTPTSASIYPKSRISRQGDLIVPQEYLRKGSEELTSIFRKEKGRATAEATRLKKEAMQNDRVLKNRENIRLAIRHAESAIGFLETEKILDELVTYSEKWGKSRIGT